MKIDFTNMDNEAIAASLADTKAKAATLFALTEPTIEQVGEAETLLASMREHETEQATRAAAVKEAGDRFAAAKASFASDDEKKEEDKSDDSDVKKDEFSADSGDEGDDEGDDESDADSDAEGDDDSDDEGDDESEAEVVTAAALKQTVKASSTASKVGRKTKRPAVKATQPVTITAAADVPEFSTGQSLSGYDEVAKAFINRAKAFPKFNQKAADQARSASGGQPVISPVGVASFGVDIPQALVASTGNDYAAVRAAIKSRNEGALTAAGWCAPSEPVYSYISDYVVDGLITVPEVGAPRGGLLLTTGPARSNNTDDFGFVQTEAQAEAGQEKPLESIECPEFTDHRLDAIGYGFTIPFLTQKAYPELIADTLKFAGVLYAHKVNKRVINDIVSLSDARTFSGYGPSVTDALEALSILAVKERRKWNIGVNAIMEVKLPEWVREVFRADMSRRAAVAYDSVNDAQIAQHFTDRHLAVEYVSDWQELGGTNVVLPGTFTAVIYPSGTFIKAIEDVVNLSAFYDTAGVTVNEYTGVFFEQGIMVAKAGYGSSKIAIPVNTAGEMGGLTLSGLGDAVANGSF